MQFKRILSAVLAAAISVSSLSVASNAQAPQSVAETVEENYLSTATTKGTIASLKSTVTNSSVKLTWGKYASGSYYKIWVKQDGAWKLLKKTADNTTLTYTASGLKANTSYTFRVGAFNASGTMTAYTDITAKTKAKVASLKSTVTNSSVKLTWSKYASGSYYKIWVKQDGAWKLLKKTADNTTLTYTASGLKANTSYTFRVGAFNASGTMTAYTDITAKTKAKVASLKSTVTNSSVKLTWGKYASGSYYKIWMQQDGAWKLLEKTADNTTLTYTASGLKANTSYTFRVGAFNASGTMTAYTDITAKTKAKVASLKSTVTNSSVKLTWGKYASGSYYKIWMQQDGAWKLLEKTADNTTLTYTASGLKANTSYTFRVGAFNASGTMTAYTDITAQTKDKIESLKATTTNSSVELTWGKYASGSYYKIWVQQDGAWKLLEKTENSTTLTYTASGLKANTSYTFRVGAFNASGTMIAYTDVTAQTKDKIESLKATTTNSSVELTWGKYAAGSYYKVSVNQNGAWKQLTQTANNTTLSYTASGLAADTSYTFRVGAYNASGTLIAYTDATAKTKDKIEGLKATTTSSSVELTWGKYAAGSYYKVSVNQNGAWKQLTQTANNTTLSYTASGLTANTSYTFRVGAYNASGTLIAYTDTTAKTANTSNIPSHTHSYSRTVTEATCTEEGYITYTCSCGDTYKETIAATGHDYTTEIYPATCYSGAYEFMICQKCGETKMNVIGSELGHSWGEWVVTKEPTAYLAGEEKSECTMCHTTQTRTITLKVDTEAYRNELITLINQKRTASGRSALTVNNDLMSFSQVRAKELEQKQSYNRPDGTSPITKIVSFSGISKGAENLAWGQRTAEQAVNDWLSNSSQLSNILNSDYNKMGAGCYQDSNGRLYWIVQFGG